jgi:hypothetical protein
MARRRIDTVEIQTNDQLIEIRWKTSQQLRGRLLGAGFHSTEKKFADKGTSAPIELEPAEKEQLLGAVRACMQTVGDEKARELLLLRTALQADLSSPPGLE